MDSIDSKTKIPALGVEETISIRRAEDKESQGDRPGFSQRKKPKVCPADGREEEASGEKSTIDILV